MVKIKSYPHELIGVEIEVLAATNRSLVGLRGRVCDETKTLLKLVVGKAVKSLLKKNITFIIKKTGLRLTGQEIGGQPEERIKGK